MRRIHIPADVKHRYRLFSPTGKYKSFRIKRVAAGGSFEAVSDARLDAINKNHLSRSLTAAEARQQVELLIEALYRADGVRVSRVESNSQNEKLLVKYLEQLPPKGKKHSQAARANYLWAAVRAVGELSLLQADASQLMAAIAAAYPDGRQARIVTSLNSLLKHLGRPRLTREGQAPPDVKYLPAEKFPAILEHLPSDAWRLLAEMAFYTGLRIGELMALERQNKKQFAINVDWQIDRDGIKRLPKNDKRRTTVPFSRVIEIYADWVANKALINSEERKFASRIVKRACKAAYPNKPEWHLRFHDLRHSYAVAALECGLSLEEIAKQLGNSIEVTERHYVGFVQSTRMEQAVFKLLNRA